MSLNKTFALLVLGVALAASVGPALAQRDTRPQTEQPQVDDGSSHGSEAGDEAIPWTLPHSMRGFSCAAFEKNGITWALLTNDTGAVVPKGSKVKIYADPGHIEMLYIVSEDWLPGTSVKAALAFDVNLGLECSLKVKYNLRPDDEPKSVPFEPGDTGKVVPKFTCELVEGGTLITNTGDVPLPTDKMIRWHIPGYNVGWVPNKPIMPGESVFLPGDEGTRLRAGAECEPTGVGGIYLPD